MQFNQVNEEGGMEVNNDIVSIALFILAFALFGGFTLFCEKA